MSEMLSGISVLDLTNNLAGPGAAAMLAEYGAEVIHIERPALGDDCRFFAPLIDGTSTSHFWINRCKKSVVLDLKDQKAIQILKRMIKDADVLIESFRPGVMDRLGLSYEEVSAIKPNIIYCSVSAFGHSGPYAARAGYDVIAQAYSGFMNYTGSKEGGPTKIGTTIGDSVGMINAYGSIMTALFHRERTGEGQYIDVSLARGLVWISASFDYKLTGVHRTRMGNHDSQLCPYGIFHGLNDTSIVIGAVNANLWKKMCGVMGRMDLADDPLYWSNDMRVEHQQEIVALVEEWLASLPSMDEAAKRLTDAGVPNCKVYRHEDLENDPHAVACGWIGYQPTPDSVTSLDKYLTKTGNVYFSKAAIRQGKAPDLGQHNYEVLSRYGLSYEEIDELESKWTAAYKKQ